MNRKFLVGALVSAAIVPAAASAAPKVGTVVDYRPASHTATVAGKSGALFAIHTAKVRVGSRVRIKSMRMLSNGTHAARLIKTGRVKHALIHGVVVSTIGTQALVIGAKGTTFVVKTGTSTTFKRTNSFDGVAPGTVVNVKVSFDGAELDAEAVHEIKAPVDGQQLHVEGRVAEVNLDTRTITVATRDDGLVSVIPVQVPDVTVDLTKWVVGAEVEFHVALNADGTYTLVSASRNDDENEADTPDSEDTSTPEPGDDPVDAPPAA